MAAVLGATGGLTAPTVIYLKIILIGVPFQIANIAMNSVIRAEGHARTAMMTMVSGMLLNIALDPVFIFVLGWGIRGAGLGTVFSQALTTALNTVGFAIMMLFPATLLGVFSSDPALIGYGVSIMRVNAVGMLFFAAYFTGPSFYQAVGKPIEALALALSRPLIATLIMFAGGKVAGAMGVVAADPAAILAGAVLAVVFMRRSFSGWLADDVRS